jgi:hypothetical protein
MDAAAPEVTGPVTALLRRVVREAVRAGWPARPLAGTGPA